MGNDRHLRCVSGIVLLLLCTFGTLVPSLVAQSHQQSSAVSGQPKGGVTNSSSSYLRVTINPSTVKVVQGAVYGVDAELENISNLPIALHVQDTSLAVQPEIAPSRSSCTMVYPATVASPEHSESASTVLQPGDRFPVFFLTGSQSDLTSECKGTRWDVVRKQLDFVPGNFTFVLTGTFTIPTRASSKSDAPNPEIHHFTETASLPVTIEQFKIVLYAGLGGFLAFLVMSVRNASAFSGYKAHVKLLIFLYKAGAAILTSATVTVIAARLASTSFPVSVSVEDFWGALTVGFVSYFIGGKFIDKISETMSSGTRGGGASGGGAPGGTASAGTGAVGAVASPSVPNAGSGAALQS